MIVSSFRLMTEFNEGESVEVNKPGCYTTVCVELDIVSLAIDALIEVMNRQGTMSFLCLYIGNWLELNIVSGAFMWSRRISFDFCVFTCLIEETLLDKPLLDDM